MAISYVGGQTSSRAGSTSTLSVNYALTGGIDTVPRDGDFVLVQIVTGTAGGTPTTAISTPSGFTDLTISRTDSANDTFMSVNYKFMTSTPDTAFTLPSTGAVQDAQTWTVRVYRGVDATTPLDVTSVSASGTGTTRPNPPSITPTTAGAYIACFGGGSSSATSAFAFGDLTGVIGSVRADNNDSAAYSGHKTDWSSGPFDCAVSSSGDTDAAGSWVAYTIALRPGGGPVTHSNTGALAGVGRVLAGTASSSTARTSTGVLLAGTGALVGAASSKTTRTSTGVLAGTGAAIVGAASSKTTRTSTGALVGVQSLVGAASSKTTRTSTGTLVGVPSLVGAASSATNRPSTGALAGTGAALAGSASRSVGAVSHATSGVLAGTGAALAGGGHLPSQITYVGGMAGGRAGSLSTATISYALTGGLTGETVPKTGDLVFINVVVGSQGRNPSCAISGFNAYGLLNASATTQDTSQDVSWKRMGATADTTFDLPSTGNVSDAQSYTVQVFRGGEGENVNDVNSTTATGTATSRADPASISPAFARSWPVVFAGGSAVTATDLAFADLTGVLSSANADDNDSVAACGYKPNWTSGAFDCAASTTGSNNAADSWTARTISIRAAYPVSTIVETFDSTLDTGLWTASTTNGTVNFAGGVGEFNITTSAIANIAHIGWLGGYRYNLLGSAAYVKIPQAMRVSGDLTGVETCFVVDFTGAGLGWIIRSDGALLIANPGTEEYKTVTTAYWSNQSTYQWFKISESGGYIYFHYAPSSASNPPTQSDWVLEHTIARSSLAETESMANCNIELYTYMGTARTVTQVAKFDGLNTAATAAQTHTATGTLAGVGRVLAGTAQHKAKHTATSTLSGGTGAVVGAASSKTTRSATGTLLAGTGALVGAASSKTTRTSTGVLAGTGAAIVGAASSKTTRTSTGALVGVPSLVGAASSKTTRSATGTLLAGTGALVGAASSKTTRTSTGALAGTGAALSGAASSKTTRTSTGVLAGTGAALVGAASSKTTRTSTGALVGVQSLVGAASSKTTRTSTGALVGAPSLVGAASSKTTRTASGALVGVSQLVGSAEYIQDAPHNATGALRGVQTLAGSALRKALHGTTGTLAGTGAALAGAASSKTTRTSTGTLVGASSSMVGAASSKTTRTSTGVLVGVPALVGAASSKTTRASTGTLSAGVGALSGSASSKTTRTSTGALVGVPSLVGAASSKTTRTSTGALVGVPSLVGAASSKTTRTASGVLAGVGRVLSADASRSNGVVSHNTAGTLAAGAASLVGAASSKTVRTATGALTGVQVLSGAASSKTVRTSTGTLVGASALSGSASSKTTRTATGSLVGVPSLAGTASSAQIRPSTGTLSGVGHALSGAAHRTRTHAIIGALAGAGCLVDGNASSKTIRTSDGALSGAGAIVAGTAPHGGPFHLSAGVLAGGGATLISFAIRPPYGDVGGGRPDNIGIKGRVNVQTKSRPANVQNAVRKNI